MIGAKVIVVVIVWRKDCKGITSNFKGDPTAVSRRHEPMLDGTAHAPTKQSLRLS